MGKRVGKEEERRWGRCIYPGGAGDSRLQCNVAPGHCTVALAYPLHRCIPPLHHTIYITIYITIYHSVLLCSSSLLLMHQNIFSSPDAAADFVACLIVRRINDFQPSAARPFVLGLPTGSSPEGVYAKLVQAYKDGKVSFAHVVTFNMDEYVGLRPEHPQLYHYFMYDKLFNHIDIPRANIHILDGLSADPETECANYEAQIRRFGRINLFLGGLGPEGHLAFNEAGLTRNSKTRRVSLAASTVKANSRFFGSEAAVPKLALSVGISTILDNLDEIVLLVFGKAKAWALEKTLYGQASDPQVPSSYLREHKNVTVVCDHAAAGLSLKL